MTDQKSIQIHVTSERKKCVDFARDIQPKGRQMWPPIYMDDGTIRRGPHADVVGRWR